MYVQNTPFCFCCEEIRKLSDFYTEHVPHVMIIFSFFVWSRLFYAKNWAKIDFLLLRSITFGTWPHLPMRNPRNVLQGSVETLWSHPVVSSIFGWSWINIWELLSPPSSLISNMTPVCISTQSRGKFKQKQKFWGNSWAHILSLRLRLDNSNKNISSENLVFYTPWKF